MRLHIPGSREIAHYPVPQLLQIRPSSRASRSRPKCSKCAQEHTFKSCDFTDFVYFARKGTLPPLRPVQNIPAKRYVIFHTPRHVKVSHPLRSLMQTRPKASLIPKLIQFQFQSTVFPPRTRPLSI